MDIIASVPWNCGERNCPVGWHLSNYWLNDSVEQVKEGYPYLVDNYADGDGELCTEEDLPSLQDQQEAWLSYYQDVATTGNDPLGEFNVKSDYISRERWEFKFCLSLRGVVLVAARRNRKVQDIYALPDHVRDFILHRGETTTSGLLLDLSREELKSAGLDTGKWQVVHIEHRVARKASSVVRELKRAARKSIARKAKS